MKRVGSMGRGGLCGGLMGGSVCFFSGGCLVGVVASSRACCPTRKVLTMSSI